jgi:hypothetical protein
MPRDPTDTAFLKGFLALAVLAGVVYYYPFPWPAEGYSGQVMKVEESREALKPTIEEYKKHYPAPPPQVTGEDGEIDTIVSARVTDIESLRRQYEREVALLQQRIKDKQAASHMDFASWTAVPPAEQDVPGFYFQRTWDRLRRQLVDEARGANVDIVDHDIGFRELTGDLRMSLERAEDLLRELFIAENVIRLCIRAKREQEALEQKKGVPPEAFMRIVSVAPEDPVRVGPYSRSNNPNYDPNERNPRSEKFQKFITREWPKFVLMYPVEIRLQCDVNSLRNFLSSVRTKGHFLVIRNLQIVSPFLSESRKDQSELNRLAPDRAREQADYKEEHILVQLSAAGMDFFEPVTQEGKPVPSMPGAKARPAGKGQPMGH